MPNRIQERSESKGQVSLRGGSSLSTALHKNRDLILERWEKLALQSVPAAHMVSSSTLRDSLPDFLDQLVENLSQPLDSQTHLREKQDLARVHGEERSQTPEYNLYQVIEEYHLLRKVIFEVLRSKAELSEEEQDIIHESIDIGIRNAASTFAKLRQQAEEEVRKEREQFFKVPNLLLCITDAKDETFVRVTPAWEHTFGFRPDELENQKILKFIHPDDYQRTMQESKANQHGQNSVDFQNRFRAKNGEYRWLQWNVSLVGDRAYCAVQDITERKKEEERQSEQARLLELTRDAILIFDQAGKILYWNQGAEAVYGYTKDEAIGQLSHQLLQTSFPVPLSEIEEALRKSGHWRGELQHVTKGGKKITVNSRWVLDQRPTGVIRILETNSDITDRKAAELALQKSYRNIREMVDSLPQLFWWTDEGGTGNHYNRRWYEYTGLPEEFESQSAENFHALIHPDDLPVNLKVREEGLKERRPVRWEERIRRWDGEYRWHLAYATPIVDEEGKLQRWYASSTDIHEQKMAEIEKAKMAESLKVDKEKLSSRNKELDRFAAIAAHDLKSPLNSMTQFAELLADQYGHQLDQEANEYISFILKAGERMRALIDNLLEFARAGVVDQRKLTEVKTSEVVEAVRRNLMADIHRTGAQISISKNLPLVRGNELQLTQLFQNLIANAIKFHKPHQIPQIEITSQADGEGFWEFLVHDEGIGIDPSQATQVFEIFSKLHGPQQYEGAGIGLAVCKKIVEAHGGKIWLESMPNVGTTFRFTLPKAHPEV